jgi:hypothetical protein
MCNRKEGARQLTAALFAISKETLAGYLLLMPVIVATQEA